MAQAVMTAPARSPRFGLLPRIAIAVVVVIALITGALNLRPLLDQATGAALTEGPSAVDALVGVEQRPATRLDAQILSLQDTLRNGNEISRGNAATLLGQAYLQKVRETGDPSYYPKAETLFNQALERDPQNVDALVGLGTLALARHQFAAALDWGEKARAVDPHHAAIYGVIGDAQVELGRYDDAVKTIQTMVDLRPDLGSYARVSYIRELMGDREGALQAMEEAATAGSGYPENVAWVQVQLGNVRFDGGDLAGASHDFNAALAAMPGYAPALAGQARVAAARGDLDDAAKLYDTAVKTIPLPEFVVAYGDVLSAAGRDKDAAAQYALVDRDSTVAGRQWGQYRPRAGPLHRRSRPPGRPAKGGRAGAATGGGAAKHRRLGRAGLDALPQRRPRRGRLRPASRRSGSAPRTR